MRHSATSPRLSPFFHGTRRCALWPLKDELPRLLELSGWRELGSFTLGNLVGRTQAPGVICTTEDACATMVP